MNRFHWYSPLLPTFLLFISQLLCFCILPVKAIYNWYAMVCVYYSKNRSSYGVIDAHRLKIQGRGYLKFLPKSQGGSRLSGKIARGVFYCIFINKCFEIYPPPPPHLIPPPPLCAFMYGVLTTLINYQPISYV
jgi:hypothetical protein